MSQAEFGFRYILPSQLSAVARKMLAVHAERKADEYVWHRVAMEPDFYEAPSSTVFQTLRDTFAVRQQVWHYDLLLKLQLEEVFERDQYHRTLWQQAATAQPQDKARQEQLAQSALQADSLNLQIVSQTLSERGFPRREQVGDFAVQAVWLVFQHADLEHQQRFLPQLEEAVGRGDIQPAFLATLKDRISLREGRPQKYGTQLDANGRVSRLLDASRVNQWRAEVGLPPIEP